jgi:hypothetical protein
MEPSSCLGPHQRTLVAITNEVQTETAGFCQKSKNNPCYNGYHNPYIAEIIGEESNTEEMVSFICKRDHCERRFKLHRGNVHSPSHQTNNPLRLEVFEVKYVGKSGLVIGEASDGREKMVAYVVSQRKCLEIGHSR